MERDGGLLVILKEDAFPFSFLLYCGDTVSRPRNRMPQIEFSLQLAEHVGCPTEGDLPEGTIREGLASWFERYPKLSEYLMDSDGNLRAHLSVFLDGEMVNGAEVLERHIAGRQEVFVMQAISGG